MHSGQRVDMETGGLGDAHAVAEGLRVGLQVMWARMGLGAGLHLGPPPSLAAPLPGAPSFPTPLPRPPTPPGLPGSKPEKRDAEQTRRVGAASPPARPATSSGPAVGLGPALRGPRGSGWTGGPAGVQIAEPLISPPPVPGGLGLTWRGDVVPGSGSGLGLGPRTSGGPGEGSREVGAAPWALGLGSSRGPGPCLPGSPDPQGWG